MKIAVGLDNVCWEHVEFFSIFLSALKYAGHKIGVITEHSIDLIDKDLDLWNKRNLPPVDFYYARHPSDIIISVEEWKDNIMEKNKIDAFIDWSEEIKQMQLILIT